MFQFLLPPALLRGECVALHATQQASQKLTTHLLQREPRTFKLSLVSGDMLHSLASFTSAHLPRFITKVKQLRLHHHHLQREARFLSHTSAVVKKEPDWNEHHHHHSRQDSSFQVLTLEVVEQKTKTTINSCSDL